MSNDNMNGALSWDSQIEQESEYVVLPAGKYNFVVESMERGHFGGSEKMSACPMAVLTLSVSDSDGNSGTMTERLYLHKKSEWRLSQFFISIGQKKKGEPLNPNWNLVPGSSGELELSVRKYKSNTGEDRETNDVKAFLPKEVRAFIPGKF